MNASLGTERWTWSSNAKDIGMCAQRVSFFARIIHWYIILNIIGSVYFTLYLSHTIGVVGANNPTITIADGERGADRFPWIYNSPAREVYNDYDKKSDTFWLLWVGLRTLISFIRYKIKRFVFSNLNAYVGNSDYTGCLKAKSHSHQETPKRKVQKSKVDVPSPNFNSDKNGDEEEPEERSASKRMRSRSRRSSGKPEKAKPENAKGDSSESPTKKQGTRNKDSLSNSSLRSFVQSRLNLFKDKDGKLNGIINILADPGYLQFCYMLIRGKPGNMSKGITNETLDGLTHEWFVKTAADIKSGKIRLTPARRVMIPKPGKSERRPLGVGAPREKIIQKGLQMILEAIYEPKFLDCSHGFRPGRSTHSALQLLHLKGCNYSWVIQGDISKCFDRIPHNVILDILSRGIKCDKFLSLIRKTLSAGYKDPDTNLIITTKIGTPQGSVLSPLLANIVLHELDKYITEEISPLYDKGLRRKGNKVYNKVIYARDPKNRNASKEERRMALKLVRTIHRHDPFDPNYRRNMYLRYADDFVFLLEGPKSEALVIKSQIKEFLSQHTGLELNDDKTLVTHLHEGFDFLGAHIKTLKRVDFRSSTVTKTGKVFTMRAKVRARVDMPTERIINKLQTLGFVRRNKSNELLAVPYTKLVNLDHVTILQFFNSKIQGLMNYYTFAGNRVKLFNLIWLLKQSAAKTLARKYKLKSMRLVFKKFGTNLKDRDTDYQLVTPSSLPAIHQYNCKNEVSPALETL
uniref:Reverse transcriptase domain-containing protein n=1 Tax=Dactylella sp. TaxID=1814903 RepID=A0A482DVM0_9PEZI|nr:hypothetical protein [Dactylella sp.]